MTVEHVPLYHTTYSTIQNPVVALHGRVHAHKIESLIASMLKTSCQFFLIHIQKEINTKYVILVVSVNLFKKVSQPLCCCGL